MGLGAGRHPTESLRLIPRLTALRESGRPEVDAVFSIGMVLGLHSKLGMVDAPVIPTLGKWRVEVQRLSSLVPWPVPSQG